MITRTSTVLAVILSAGIAFTAGSPAVAKDRDDQGQVSVTSKHKRRHPFRDGVPGIAGVKLNDPGTSNSTPAPFGNGTGSTTPGFGNGVGSTAPPAAPPARFGNGTGSTTPGFGNGVGSSNQSPPPVILVPPTFGSGNGYATKPKIVNEPTIQLPKPGSTTQNGIGLGYATMPNTSNAPPLQGIQQRPPTDKQVDTGYATAPGIINEPTIQQQKPAPATQKM